MRTIAEIEVAETHGMRRFLYPLNCALRGVFRMERVRVAEADGTLVPSQSLYASDWAGSRFVEFAVSLAPLETRRLLLVETDEVPDIPDRIMRTAGPEGVTYAQQRFAHTIDGQGRLASVVYDGVGHLAGRAVIELGDAEAVGSLENASESNDGLGALAKYVGTYGECGPAFYTIYNMTACKSWIGVRHVITGAPAGSRVTFTLPMAATGTTSTCDFGVGNGLYGKLAAGPTERVIWHTELSGTPNWWLGSSAMDSSTVRVDAAGKLPAKAEINNYSPLGAQGWFHWTDADKAIAVALVTIDPTCEEAVVSLDKSGRILVSFVLGDKPRPESVFDLCWHFLNDIPPIAAATNPASILLPPVVRVASA